MKAVLLCAVLALAAAFPAGAQEAFGRVEGVYYEAARGVFLAARGGETRGRWADVDVGGRKVLARVPDGMPVSPGDRIALQLGDPKSSPLARVLPTTTVTRAIAPDPNASIGR